MSRKFVVCLCLVSLALAGAPILVADEPIDEVALRQQQNQQPVDITGPRTRALETPVQTVRNANRNVPTGIIYDDGVANAAPAVSSFCYGNQFNTVNGTGTVKSFSVTQLSFFMLTGAGTDNVFISVFGPVVGTAAPVLTSASVPAPNSGAFNTVTISPAVGTGSFLAGVWYIGGDTVGLGTGTVNGQGHHGMMINDIAGTGFAALGTVNALVGASTAFVPVELMSFSVSDE